MIDVVALTTFANFPFLSIVANGEAIASHFRVTHSVLRMTSSTVEGRISSRTPTCSPGCAHPSGPVASGACSLSAVPLKTQALHRRRHDLIFHCACEKLPLGSPFTHTPHCFVSIPSDGILAAGQYTWWLDDQGRMGPNPRNYFSFGHSRSDAHRFSELARRMRVGRWEELRATPAGLPGGA